MRVAVLAVLVGCSDAAAPLDAGGLDARVDELDARVVDAGVQDARVQDARVRDASMRTRQNLVVHEFWSQLGASEDPFDRPADAACKRGGVMPELLAEEPVFSVDTGFCSYITVAQPTLRDVAAGDTLKVRLWHFELSAPQPAFAHAEVMIDDLAVLDEQIPIPSPGGLLVRELVAPHAIPPGAQAYFHLHNHGSNSWSLVEISSGP